jgi:hypothetical protein
LSGSAFFAPAITPLRSILSKLLIEFQASA